MQNTVKALMLAATFLQGTATFAQEFKKYPDHKVIVDIQDTNRYLIPGGACGNENWEGNGPHQHECKVHTGGVIEIVSGSDFCSYKEIMNGENLTLEPGRQKNCDKIQHQVIVAGNVGKITVTGQKLAPVPIGISPGKAFEYKVDPTSYVKCGSTVIEKELVACTVDPNGLSATPQPLFTLTKTIVGGESCIINGAYTAKNLQLTKGTCSIEGVEINANTINVQ